MFLVACASLPRALKIKAAVVPRALAVQQAEKGQRVHGGSGCPGRITCSAPEVGVGGGLIVFVGHSGDVSLSGGLGSDWILSVGIAPQ